METTADQFMSIGGNREVQYFGEYGYKYTGQSHEAKETPLAIQTLLDAIRPTLGDRSNSWLNSRLVTKYKDGDSHIPMHRDNEAPIDPDSIIVTASIGMTRTMKFSNGNEEQSLEIGDGSVYVMTRYSQDHWEHGIPPIESIAPDGPDNMRYSFTFRHIAPHFLNSTVLIGDSNTQYVKFGSGFGTLGRWVPGKRIKAAKIQDIPSPNDIGPFRNVVIHTGINNLTENSRPSSRALVSQLRVKCKDIHTVYPNAKIHISLLLPTKSSLVNNRVTELNNMILDMAFGMKNLFVMDNSVLGSDNGCLQLRYGRHISPGIPNANDIVHLGRDGLRLFCKNIKQCILNKGRNQSRERFQASQGSYRSAFMGGSSVGLNRG